MFTLELLHAADQEAGIPALDDAPRFSAVLNALKAEDLGGDGVEDNTLVLSSGDAILPGLFFSASEEVFGGAGRADIAIQNELGFQAIALGNHEFDLNTDFLAGLIAGDAATGFDGTAFPYLSANLDFSTDANLAPLVTTDGEAPAPNTIAGSTVIDVNGESVGVVGVTTPTITSIASPGDVTVNPADSDDIAALAATIQPTIDALIDSGINKVVVLSHLQQIALEQALAPLLSGVDIIVAGGSNTLLADNNDELRDGDVVQGQYPIFTTNADGEPLAIVNTDGNYKYVGRLVVEFDENGVIDPSSYDADVSGAYATDDAGVAALGAEGLVDPEIQDIVDELRAVIEAKESNVFGISEVYLDGTRGSVRTQETNLGNLTADANLAIAREITGDDTILVSLKNGGGIRDDIGRVIIPAGGTGEPDELPNEGIPDVKPEGGISETDIANTLRFNNGLTVLDITREGLVAVLEHGIAASSLDDSNTQGRFPQVSGVEFSFDLTLPENDRIQSAAIKDEDGNILDVLVENGKLVGEADASVRIVTLGFLAGGGDDYPFADFGSNFQDLDQEEEAPRTGDATFAPDGTEQDALAEYLFDNFLATPFDIADTERDLDERLQNLAFRSDSVLEDTTTPGGEVDFSGTDGRDRLIGTDADEVFESFGDNDAVRGFGGNDTIRTGDGNDQIFGDMPNTFGMGGNDFVDAGDGNDEVRGNSGNDTLLGGAGLDRIFGGEGDDLIRGGEGNDILKGDSFRPEMGNDTFVLAAGEGTDTIRDFQVGEDFIGLADGLTFGDLSFSDVDGVAQIAAGDETLAILNRVSANDLMADSFVTV